MPHHIPASKPPSDFEWEFLAHFRALSEDTQCMIAELVASQIKDRKSLNVAAYGELTLVKGA